MHIKPNDLLRESNYQLVLLLIDLCILKFYSLWVLEAFSATAHQTRAIDRDIRDRDVIICSRAPHVPQLASRTPAVCFVASLTSESGSRLLTEIFRQK